MPPSQAKWRHCRRDAFTSEIDAMTGDTDAMTGDVTPLQAIMDAIPGDTDAMTGEMTPSQISELTPLQARRGDAMAGEQR